MGVPPRQRVVYRLQRAARHVGDPLSRAREPRVRRQDQPAVSVLTSRTERAVAVPILGAGRPAVRRRSRRHQKGCPCVRGNILQSQWRCN